MFSDTRHGDRYFQLASERDPRDVLYVYRWEDQAIDGPFVYKGPVLEDLQPYLQTQHHGGDFNVMVRRGSKMLLSELVSIFPPPTDRVRFEAYKRKLENSPQWYAS